MNFFRKPIAVSDPFVAVALTGLSRSIAQNQYNCQIRYLALFGDVSMLSQYQQPLVKG